MSADQSNPHRLPATYTPSRYSLSLTPDITAATFSGRVQIDGELLEAVDEIWLNAEDLTITESRVAGESVECRVEAETARLALARPESVSAGEVTIELAFEGAFNQQLVGLYASSFTDDDGNEQRLATTQFEATNARKCFPCWDEPHYKATFELELIIDPEHQAVANTAEVSRTTIPAGNGQGAAEKLAVQFAPTIVMSTYLVAFVVGPLEFSPVVDVGGTPLRVVTIPGRQSLGTFALEAGAFALRYFEEYFDLPYPGDKVDLVAIPDFAFGAMENLGCITFRETALLLDPARATQGEMQRVADVINHELAHMWFGDLVTMTWWNGLWLNEAFATFMELRCTDAFRPEWLRWVDFGVSRSEAFDVDALASTRPIEFDVVSPEDAEAMFDILTYEKGAAIVRMLEQYLGEDRFRAGIRRYMRDHAYGNADTGDLWDAIESETGEPVRRLMESWIFQGGFPLVEVALSSDRRNVSISQSRFGYVGGDPVDNREWALPVVYRWQARGEEEPRLGRCLLESDRIEIPLDGEAEWIVVNAEASGFYRVAYPPTLRDELAERALEALTPAERYCLVDDAWALVLADRSTAAEFLALAETMSIDGDRSVWQRIVAGFGSLDRLVSGDARERLQGVIHDAAAPALAGLGLSPLPADSDRDRQLRGDLIRTMGVLAQDHEIQEEAKRTVAEGMRDPQLVEASIMAAAVSVTAVIGDTADFDSFVEASATATTPQDEVRYLMALADFPEPELAERVHAMILGGEIRTQNAPFWLARALANRSTGELNWQFITSNWDDLLERFPTGAIGRMVSGVIALAEPDQIAATEAFFADHPIPQAGKGLAQTLERQRIAGALRQRESTRFAAILG